MVSVFRALDWFTKDQSYLAAAALSGQWRLDLGSVAPASRTNWESYAASSWKARLALYESILDCSQPFPEGGWRAAIHACADVERLLLEQTGFVFKVMQGEQVFVAQLSEHKLQARMRRYHTEAIRRGDVSA